MDSRAALRVRVGLFNRQCSRDHPDESARGKNSTPSSDLAGLSVRFFVKNSCVLSSEPMRFKLLNVAIADIEACRSERLKPPPKTDVQIVGLTLRIIPVRLEFPKQQRPNKITRLFA